MIVQIARGGDKWDDQCACSVIRQPARWCNGERGNDQVRRQARVQLTITMLQVRWRSEREIIK
jgi:hypothetical protein